MQGRGPWLPAERSARDGEAQTPGLCASRDHDRLSGNEGADRINGGGGSDRVSGNSGNDTIDGGEAVTASKATAATIVSRVGVRAMIVCRVVWVATFWWRAPADVIFCWVGGATIA